MKGLFQTQDQLMWKKRKVVVMTKQIIQENSTDD